MNWRAEKIETVAISDIKPWENNPRTHNDSQVQKLVDAIQEFGFTTPLLMKSDGTLIAGHGRLEAARRLGLESVPAIFVDHLSQRQLRALVISDNKLATLAGWDYEALSEEISKLAEEEYDLSLTGFDEQELDALLKDDLSILPDPIEGPLKTKMPARYADSDTKDSGALYRKFGYPPFSVLNTQLGAWQERKRYWVARVGDLGETREASLSSADLMMAIGSGVSILDGTMAELMCRWFAKPGFKAFDPFAGDTVFGFVSACCGLDFTGIELRPEQAQINNQRVRAAGLSARYINDDAANMDGHIEDESMDFMFTCPPYADLEVYSDDPRDLSRMSHAQFFKAYEMILRNTYKKLRKERFAVVVVSEVRGPKGEYINLVGRTAAAMQKAGFIFYNEMILMTVGGTLPIRVGRQFNASRKIGRMHQNILVFYKGNPANIKDEFGDVIPDEEMEEDGDGL